MAKAMAGEPLRYFNDVVMTYEGDDCLPWPFSVMESGYGQLRFNGRSRSIGPLICEMKYGPKPPLHLALHQCRTRSCANYRHYRWGTASQNQADRVRDGTSNRGEQGPSAKLTEEAVLEIRKIGRAVPLRELGSRYGVTDSAISCVLLGRSWSWL
jgi:hypothetical protein